MKNMKTDSQIFDNRLLKGEKTGVYIGKKIKTKTPVFSRKKINQTGTWQLNI